MLILAFVVCLNGSCDVFFKGTTTTSFDVCIAEAETKVAEIEAMAPGAKVNGVGCMIKKPGPKA